MLEITVNSVTSALLAQEGGADRIELCDNFHEGGTTPGAGSIAQAREFHASLRTRRLSEMSFQREGVFMGDHRFPCFTCDVASPERIRMMKQILENG